jgi:hypothetical protein
MTTQKITRQMEDAALDAFGGPAARPPQPLEMGDVLARETFEARHAAAQAAAAAPLPPLGNSTFDPAPSEMLARRAKVGIVRDRLGSLARLILSEQAALTPILSDLADDSALVREAEAFEVETAGDFLTALTALVTGLSTPKPVKKKA